MTLHDFLSDNPSGKKRQCRDRVSRGDFLSSTWVKVASASNRCRTWLSTHEARRVEVERAKGRGCLTRSVKLAQLVRYCSFSAEAVTIALSAAPPAREWSAGMRAT